MPKVLGVGGVFFKSPDPAALRAWYARWLGMFSDDYGVSFHPDALPEGAYTVWSPFPADTAYFEPSPRGVMVNLIVDDLDAMLDRLRGSGAQVLDAVEELPEGEVVLRPDAEAGSRGPELERQPPPKRAIVIPPARVAEPEFPHLPLRGPDPADRGWHPFRCGIAHACGRRVPHILQAFGSRFAAGVSDPGKCRTASDGPNTSDLDSAQRGWDDGDRIGQLCGWSIDR